MEIGYITPYIQEICGTVYLTVSGTGSNKEARLSNPYPRVMVVASFD